MTQKENNKNAKQIRFLAVQSAYAYAIHSSINKSICAKTQQIIIQNHPQSAQVTSLITFLVKNNAIVDQIIGEHLANNWTISRINMVTLAILRVAVTEIITKQIYTQSKMTNSYLSIAEIMLEKNEVNFINAMISKITNNFTTQHNQPSAASQQAHCRTSCIQPLNISHS
ncbi:hypothetical protein CAXC1_120014 [Candidatus Xenohaliotis californiensis]|uniref:NusB/RsmB/TIM44 domain-containing protein n=1 Tax=Candidatus Xenohaliotis californiensis TaxID=84677 RepID=A0ABP0ERR7_9RICK|nr:hypothetical protein CAXC1_120014 [Candidatus Xenohaliotis californiensis]